MWCANKPQAPGVSSLEEEDLEQVLGTVDFDALCEGSCYSGSDLDALDEADLDPLDEDGGSGSESGGGWTDSLEDIAIPCLQGLLARR